MTFRLFYQFIRDLFQVLPRRSKEEWGEVRQLKAELPTVILVSGFAATRRSLSIVRKRLQRDGFNVLILALDWESLALGFKGLLPMALKLSSLVLAIKKDKVLARSPIFLVSHSAGGLICRHYVQILGGSHYCEGLITIGTPHKGTWVAGLGLFTHLILKAKCLWDMLPWSALVHGINAAPWPQGFPLLSIQSRGDYLSYKSAGQLPEKFFDGSSPIEKKVVRGLSHSELLRSKHVYAYVLAEIRRRLPAPEGVQPVLTVLTDK